MKKTLVVGASAKPERYAFTAVNRLTGKGHEVIAIGNKPGQINDIAIRTDRPQLEDLDTITLYINPTIQRQYYDYLLSLNPKRIIFNPGTENPEFMQLAREKGIEVEAACTLVMLSTNLY